MEVKPVRARAFVAGLILVIAMAVFNTFLNGFTYSTGWPYEFQRSGLDYTSSVIWRFIQWPFIVSLVFALLARPLKLSRQEMVVILSMAWISWLIPTWYGVGTTYTWIGASIMAGDPWKSYMLIPGMVPPWFAPSTEAVAVWEGFIYGGAAVPWAEWILPVIFYTFYISVAYLTCSLAATLLRRPWIDIEALPYPLAIAGVYLVDEAVGEKKRSLLKNRWIWLGAVIGVFFPTSVAIWLPHLIPAIPIMDTWTPLDITPLAIFHWAPISFAMEAWAVAAFYIVPTSFLLSYAVFYLIFCVIIPPILTAMGFIDPMEPGTSVIGAFWHLFSYAIGPIQLEHFYDFAWGTIYGFFLIGIMAACVIWPLITVDRRYFVESIKAIFKKPPPEVEAREPISYRWQWIILILLWLLWAAIIHAGSLGAMPFHWALIWALAPVLWVGLFSARFYGEFGGVLTAYSGDGRSIGHLFYNVYGYWWMISEASPTFAGGDHVTGFHGVAVTSFPLFWYSNVTTAVPAARVMEAYKMADLTNTHSRYIYLAVLIAIPITILVSIISGLTFVYLFGAGEKWAESGVSVWGGLWQGLCAHLTAKGDYKWQWWPEDVPPPATLHVAEGAGFIFAIAMFILRAKVAALAFLHPITFYALTALRGELILTPIVALVLKWLTVRIGGIKLYEERGLPIAIGIGGGWGIMLIISAIIEAWRTLMV